MKKILIALLFIGISQYTNAQLNVELLHQLVGHSKDEYELQVIARNKQAINSTNQEIITEQSSRYKKRYIDLSKRFMVISTALQALNSSVESASIVQQIIQEQQHLIGLVSADPIYLPLVIPTQHEILDKAKLLARYILGLMLSASDLNYMSQSDRRILFDHAIKELREILAISKGLNKSIYYSSLRKKLNATPENFFQQDKEIAQRILNQIEGIKNEK